MKAVESFPRLFKRFWRHIRPRRRKQFGLLMSLMVVSSFAEILSIGSVLPFIGAMTSPERIFQNPYVQPMVRVFGLTHPSEILLPMALAFCLAALVAGSLRILLLWVSIKYSFAVGSDLSNDVYRRTLYQPYAVHIARNSSEIINVISGKTNEVIFYVLLPFMNLIGSAVMLLVLVVGLSLITPAVALLTFAGFGLIYSVIVKKIKNRVKENSHHIAHESTQAIKYLQEGLGGIRDILIDGTQETFCNIYRKTNRQLRSAQGNNQFMSFSPRFGMEAVGMVMIAVLAYVLSQKSEGIGNALPVLAALALGMQRILPALQQGYQAWSTIQGAQVSLSDTLNLLDQPLPETIGSPGGPKLKFEESIRIRDLSFRYSNESAWILNDVGLVIPKGSRVGFIGTTGSGKSTLVDIVMGLLEPVKGSIEVDGIAVDSRNMDSWRNHIAHVPQSVFLADGTIEENIAFGVPKEEIDPSRVRHAASQAQMADIIATWPNGYQTRVGERGVQLSGGQRQRIGIARAVYKHADVLVLDEATSALDTQTEESVMQAIEALSNDITILIIAHRLTTVRNCTQIVRLEKGTASVERDFKP